MPRSPLRPISQILWAAAAVLLAASATTFVSWQQDRALLWTISQQVVAGRASDQTRALALLHWVYANQVFEKNKRYFLLPRLEATPVQVLQDGGDCADKSRLLGHMLQAVGIDASLVMLKPCDECSPSHTVVMAHVGNRWTPLDAVFDLDFPGPGGGGRDIAELKADSGILLSRLDELREARGHEAKVAFYKRDAENYQSAETINWRKNAVLQAIGTSLFGRDAWRVPRPMILEDPEGLVATATLAAGLLGALVASVASVAAARVARRPAAPETLEPVERKLAA